MLSGNISVLVSWAYKFELQNFAKSLPLNIVNKKCMDTNYTVIASERQIIGMFDELV